MSQQDRKAKRLLAAEQKYDLWVRMLAGQITQAEAAAEAGVDRSVISRLARSLAVYRFESDGLRRRRWGSPLMPCSRMIRETSLRLTTSP